MREFARYLVERFPGSTVRWVTERRDPPDFWVWHRGRKYAVEVTSVRHQEDVTVRQGQWGMLKEVERDARDTGELSGEYGVVFRNPWKSRRQREEVKKRIHDYVRKTGAISTEAGEDIVAGGRVICHIQKWRAGGAALYPADGGLDLGGFEPDIRRELRPLLEKAIAGKASKMAKLTCPKALVLLDEYRLALRPCFCECVRSVAEAREFAYIYVVESTSHGYAVRQRSRP
ncbi:MAG TPA: hypothetical protein PKK06_17210 [Phycisphaerae bacterium]|nr:hypothetical protein [Phycisphaerae bacterium]